TAYNIVTIDTKKQSDSESIAFEFHIKKVSAYSMTSNVLEGICKFPYPFQKLLVKEACAVIHRLEK
ncbi:10629_t:CDS:1, partial [Scutellospora calospora]